MRAATTHANQTFAVFEKMDVPLKAIERANETLRTNASHIRSARDRALNFWSDQVLSAVFATFARAVERIRRFGNDPLGQF